MYKKYDTATINMETVVLKFYSLVRFYFCDELLFHKVRKKYGWAGGGVASVTFSTMKYKTYDTIFCIKDKNLVCAFKTH